MKHARIRFVLITLLLGIGGMTAYAVTEGDKLTAADAAAGDWFGVSVAVSGTTVVVGALFDDDAGSNSGSAYVFDCSSFLCVQVSKLTTSDAEANDLFGGSVAVSGTTAVVGATFDEDPGGDPGAAYYFDLSNCGVACTESGKLTASDAAVDDYFGVSVAVSGTIAVIGAAEDDDAGSASGSAYYFDLSSCGAACTEDGKLTASDAAGSDSFGGRVAVSGTTAVVGAYRNDGAGNDSGAAYYFDFSSCGAACTESGKLTASDAAANDLFGGSVAVSGTTAMVGARFDDDAGSASGSAYYFDLSSCGEACTESGKLTASDAAGADRFGSVAVSGTTAVVGAFSNVDAGSASGSAYYFDLSSCGTACTEDGKLTASDAAAVDRFGYSVAVSGTTTVVGAFRDDDAGDDSGSAYVFIVPPATKSISKTSTTQMVTTAGEVVPYNYVIRNTGKVTLHDVALTDDNVDAPPVCRFSGNDELLPAGSPGSIVACQAEHTATPQEISAEGTLDNTATATSDEAQPVMASLGIPIGISLDGFEGPSCPCWTLEEIVALPLPGSEADCVSGPTGIDLTHISGCEYFHRASFSEAGLSCSINRFDCTEPPDAVINIDTTDSQFFACLDQIVKRCEELGIEPPPFP